jgi:hypothetical protein
MDERVQQNELLYKSPRTIIFSGEGGRDDAGRDLRLQNNFGILDWYV